MGLIVEFTAQSPLMASTIRGVPGLTFDILDFQILGDDKARSVFWAECDDFPFLESSLKDDKTVESFSLLVEDEEKRLYKVTFPEKWSEQLLYPYASEYGIVYMDVTSTADGTRVRAQAPSRDAVRDYIDVFREKDIPFQLHGLYEQNSDHLDARYGLTPSQHEAIVLAYEHGYYSDPRETELEALADELGISKQAFASRLRRGYGRLIRNTLIEET